jgi:hypothetical protein
MVKVKDVNGTTYLDQGLARFSIAYNIKDRLLQGIRGNIFNVTIFDYNMIEVVKRCPQDDPALVWIDE